MIINTGGRSDTINYYTLNFPEKLSYHKLPD